MNARGTVLRVRFLAALVASILLAALGPAHAARDCKELQIADWTADSARDGKQCLADLAPVLDLKTCSGQPICKALAEWRNLPTPQLLADASAQVLAVRERLATSIDQQGVVEAQPALARIDRFLVQLRDVTVEQLRASSTGPLATGAASAWAYDVGSHTVLAGQEGEVRVGDLLDQECKVSATRCVRALRSGAAVAVAAWQMNLVADALLRDKREALVAHVAVLDERWTRYFAASRSQYPWELALNSVLFTHGRRTAMGLVGPPTEQWAFLHPAVGMRYRSGAETRYDAALVLEVVGYQRWRWSGSEMTGLMGGALVAAWTDKNKRDRPAVGLVWHMRDNYSIGVMHDSSGPGRKITLTVSADLSKLFLDQGLAKDKLLGR